MVRRSPDTSYLPLREDTVRTLTPDKEESQALNAMKKENQDTMPIVAMIRAQMFGLRSETSQKTRAVVEDCVRLKNQGKRTMVVLHRRKHFEVLTSALQKQGLVVDIWSGAVSQKERSQKLKAWQWVRDHSKKATDIIRSS